VKLVKSILSYCGREAVSKTDYPFSGERRLFADSCGPLFTRFHSFRLVFFNTLNAISAFIQESR
jgi:hypothetical protein